MKSIVKFILALFLLFTVSNVSQAQTNIPLPNSSFENWSTGSGYSVTVLFFPLSVYSSYPYPNDWDYPTYPVNQTITYSGMNVNVNTNLPLLKVSHETSSVADGSSALKMQTFMLSDIISSTVYSLAESSIDPQLTSMVIPTILSTGVLDLDQMFPFMTSITSNMNSIAQLMATFVNEDINDFVTGGIALNGQIPGHLTGQYKYTSATGSGDNGGILMIGTKYNNSTHRREVVGAGYTTSLTDVSTYTSFDIQYRPMGEIIPTQPMIDPDSLVIFLFSSANNQRQQGSALYLDNLQLWSYVPEIPEDTCSDVAGLVVDFVDSTMASLGWIYNNEPDHWEVEYGVQGFAQGSGIVMTTVNNSLILSELQPDTYYDVYVRSVCNDSLAGNWASISFKTDTLVPPVTPPDPETCPDVTGLTVDYVDTTLANISWTLDETPDHWEAEYGIQGFAQGSGNMVTTNTNSLVLSELQADTYYDVYVRSVCDEGLVGDWATISFKTDTLVPPANPDTTSVQTFAADHLICYPNPANGQCQLQFQQEKPLFIQLFSIDGKLLQQITPQTETITVSLPYSGVFILRCEMAQGIIVRKIINH